MSDLVGNSEDRFSRVAAHIYPEINPTPRASMGSYHGLKANHKGSLWSKCELCLLNECPYRKVVTLIKVRVGNDQEMAQSERNSHSKNPRWKNLQSGTYTKTTYRKPSEQLCSQ